MKKMFLPVWHHWAYTYVHKPFSVAKPLLESVSDITVSTNYIRVKADSLCSAIIPKSISSHISNAHEVRLQGLALLEGDNLYLFNAVRPHFGYEHLNYLFAMRTLKDSVYFSKAGSLTTTRNTSFLLQRFDTGEVVYDLEGTGERRIRKLDFSLVDSIFTTVHSK
jgi:hypothetical protein